MICPECGSGPIHRAQLRRDGKEIYICEECDCVWLETIESAKTITFDELMKAYGVNLALWSELKLIEIID